jgi:hypothetical protein
LRFEDGVDLKRALVAILRGNVEVARKSGVGHKQKRPAKAGTVLYLWSLMNDVRISLNQNENMLHINAFVEFAKTCGERVV